MESPKIQDLALANKATYNDETPIDYTKQENLSNKEIYTYRHNEKPHYIIAHKGTNLSTIDSAKKDIRADLNIAIGNKDADALHDRRTKRTEKIIKKIKIKDPEHDIFLTAHSLGGSTASDAMVKSKFVRDNVKELHTFNSASSKLQNKPDISPDTKKILMEKSTHHHIRGDLLSQSVSSNLIGKHKRYNSTKKPSISQRVLEVATPLLKRSVAGKILDFGLKKVLGTLQSHSIDNFY